MRMCFFKSKTNLTLILLHAFSSVLSVGHLGINTVGSPIQVRSRSLMDLGFHSRGLEVTLNVLAHTRVK